MAAQVGDQNSPHKIFPAITTSVELKYYGTLEVIITFDEEGSPFELRAILLKADSSARSLMEGISNVISLYLQEGGDLQQIIEKLRGITDQPEWIEHTLYRSVPNAIAHILEEMLFGNRS